MQISGVSGADALMASAARAREDVGDAAAALAGAGLPMTPDAPAVDPGVDVAAQLTTMIAAGDAHSISVAALKIALDTYSSMLDIIPRA